MRSIDALFAFDQRPFFCVVQIMIMFQSIFLQMYYKVPEVTSYSQLHLLVVSSIWKPNMKLLSDNFEKKILFDQRHEIQWQFCRHEILKSISRKTFLSTELNSSDIFVALWIFIIFHNFWAKLHYFIILIAIESGKETMRLCRGVMPARAYIIAAI